MVLHCIEKRVLMRLGKLAVQVPISEFTSFTVTPLVDIAVLSKQLDEPIATRHRPEFEVLEPFDLNWKELVGSEVASKRASDIEKPSLYRAAFVAPGPDVSVIGYCAHVSISNGDVCDLEASFSEEADLDRGELVLSRANSELAVGVAACGEELPVVRHDCSRILASGHLGDIP